MITARSLLAAADQLTELWSPKVVGQVNDQYIKVAKLRGEFTWHAHAEEDELFQVLRGTLRIQFENQPDVILSAGDFCIVPRGTRHNPVAKEECLIALIESITTKHTGDIVTEQSRSIEEQLS